MISVLFIGGPADGQRKVLQSCLKASVFKARMNPVSGYMVTERFDYTLRQIWYEREPGVRGTVEFMAPADWSDVQALRHMMTFWEPSQQSARPENVYDEHICAQGVGSGIIAPASTSDAMERSGDNDSGPRGRD